MASCGCCCSLTLLSKPFPTDAPPDAAWARSDDLHFQAFTLRYLGGTRVASPYDDKDPPPGGHFTSWIAFDTQAYPHSPWWCALARPPPLAPFQSRTKQTACRCSTGRRFLPRVCRIHYVKTKADATADVSGGSPNPQLLAAAISNRRNLTVRGACMPT